MTCLAQGHVGEGLDLGFEPRSLLTIRPMFSLYCIALCFLWKQVVKVLSHRKGAGSLGKAHRSRVSALWQVPSVPRWPVPQQSGVGGVQVHAVGLAQGPLEGHDAFVVLNRKAHCKVR